MGQRRSRSHENSLSMFFVFCQNDITMEDLSLHKLEFPSSEDWRRCQAKFSLLATVIVTQEVA
jgi:hypothetical protein